MKNPFLILLFLFSLNANAQYNYNNGRTCDFILVQGDTSLITAFNGLDKKDYGIYMGVRYQGLFSGSIFYTPFNAINRLGISKDRNSFDIVLSSHISDITRYGFGISFPIQYRNNFRL